MKLYQPESGYSYNSDSLFLYDFINSFKPRGKVLDVGAGCGIVGLLVARDNKKVELEAVEKQAVFINYAQKNADENALSYKLHHSDFIANIVIIGIISRKINRSVRRFGTKAKACDLASKSTTLIAYNKIIICGVSIGRNTKTNRINIS